MRVTVASQFVGHELPTCLALLLEKSTKETGGGSRVPPCLHQKVQDLAILIHGSMQRVQFSVDPHENRFDEPLTPARTRSFPQPIGIDRTESDTPAPDGLVRHTDASFRSKVLDIPIAETEAIVEPNGVTDEFLGEPDGDARAIYWISFLQCR
jgi:hypothetical protein